MARRGFGQVIAEVGQVGLGTRGITEAKVPQHPIQGSRVGDEVPGRSPQGLQEAVGAHGVRGQPAPREVEQGCKARKGTCWRVAPTNHAPVADVGQAFHGFNGGQEGLVGSRGGEDVRIRD